MMKKLQSCHEKTLTNSCILVGKHNDHYYVYNICNYNKRLMSVVYTNATDVCKVIDRWHDTNIVNECIDHKSDFHDEGCTKM